ncbi:MAG: hypothetical protein U0800_17295 [Isosphaeraceae bacterium]
MPMVLRDLADILTDLNESDAQSSRRKWLITVGCGASIGLIAWMGWSLMPDPRLRGLLADVRVTAVRDDDGDLAIKVRGVPSSSKSAPYKFWLELRPIGQASSGDAHPLNSDLDVYDINIPAHGRPGPFDWTIRIERDGKVVRTETGPLNIKEIER